MTKVLCDIHLDEAVILVASVAILFPSYVTYYHYDNPLSTKLLAASPLRLECSDRRAEDELRRTFSCASTIWLYTIEFNC